MASGFVRKSDGFLKRHRLNNNFKPFNSFNHVRARRYHLHLTSHYLHMQRLSATPLSSESFNCILYAIELDPSAMEDPAFRAKNPDWIPGMPLVYVGMTSLSAEERCEQHLRGTTNVSRIAHQYGRRLRMDLVPIRKPTRRTWAMKLEARLARDLRARGFGAWKG